MRKLSTIGYERANPEAFDRTLAANGIDLVVDVRAVAVSRRPGFSKSALSARLNATGIAYIHIRDLGDPKPGREAARAGYMALFRKIYADHLATREGQAGLRALADYTPHHNVALLCFEADATGCHRAIVADRIAKDQNLRIVHLSVAGEARKSDARTYDHSRKGMAAA